MKKWCLAALAIASTALTTAFAQLPTGYGLHYSPQELAIWRQRAVSGPYKATGDVSPYSPGDWNRIATFAATFKADPYNAGNDNLEARNIWIGWTVPVHFNNAQVPVWQGFKMQSAAFYYLIKGDTSYGNTVRRALLHQIGIPAAQIGTWNPAVVSYESGFFEANWLCRLLTSYDYTKDLFSAAERTRMDAWFRSAANYYCTRVTTGPIGQCFPKRLQDDYTVVSSDAQPGGIPSYPDPIWPKSTYPRHAWSPDGYIYTHVNADGSLGNRVSRLAMHYSNRISDKMSFVGQLGVFLNDAFFKLHAKQYAKEFIKYSTYPDGTYGEYERNGDYGNVNQGFQYGAKNISNYVILADALARKGDFSLYAYSTNEGAHNTVGGPKSLLTLLTRFGNNFIGADPIYYSSVSDLNRIDNVSENNGRMAVWDYMLAISNRYYKSDFFKNIYRHTASGSVPYNNLFTSVGGVYVAWNCSGGELPGVLFLNALMEDVNVYQYPCGTPTNLAAQAVTQTGASISWDAITLAQNYKLRYRTIGATAWTEITSNTSTFVLGGLDPGTGYQVQVQTNCQAGNLSSWSATLSFTTAQPTCAMPTGLAVGSITDVSAIVNANPVAGAQNYSMDLRVQGSPSWTTTTPTAMPVTLSLAPGMTYEVRLRTNCSATNSSAYTTEVTFSTSLPACNTPGGLAASTIGTDSASMSWGAVANASQYRLRFKPAASSNWKFVVVATNRYAEGSLLPSTRYEYQVMTDCILGNSSGYSSSAFFTTGTPACPVVTGLAMSQITETGATASYTSTGSGVLGYQLRYRKVGTTAWTSVNDAASPLAISGLASVTSYEIQARALCSLDSSAFTALVNFTTATPACNTPTGFAAGNLTQTSATMAWTPVAGADGYEVQYREDNGTGQGAYTTITSTQPLASISGLDPGKDYNARVRTKCPGGQTSNYSSIIDFSTPDPVCDAPTGLTFSGITATQANINWTVLGGIQSYSLRYRPAGQTAWTTISPATSPKLLNGLTAAVQYELQVQAVCDAGNQSEYSASVTFSTTGNVCYTPINMTATVEDQDSVYMTWSGIPNIRGYVVSFFDPSNPHTPIRKDTVNNYRYGFTGFDAGRTYRANVYTLCTIGSSYSSAPVTFTMPSGCSAQGTVKKEIWTNMAWQAGQPLPVRAPERVESLSTMEDSTTTASGTVLVRVKGYICPPATGNYTFYLSGTDVAELYLGIRGDSASRQKIAYITHGTQFRQFNSAASATSVGVRLVHGQKYYLEAVYAGENGRTHFSMAWRTPESESVRLITASRFTSTAGAASPLAVGEASLNRQYALYPNPSSPQAPVYLSGPEGEASVMVSDATGKLAWQGSLNLGGNAEALPTALLKSGLYLVQVAGRQGHRQTLRMVVQ